ncbi:coiled-coil domain-containing protein 13 [Limosa lapponica baueri]|uniref:Coiled-coil domain-containing protein 13 n=1 Tax=Limosa lapponica baueri TaxID=1758121 RepID=A0A2I0TPP0_LIMLA|nr:coiled-coil domain-containing protein 13 [Limosa lapponica baueri]
MESDIKVSEDFKSQFKAYQEQQQRRLQSLMERKKEKQNSQKGDNSNAKETFRIPNDLNLFERGQPVNEDDSKRLLEIENEQLQDQLREVRDENCRLYKLVTEKDFEIKQLQKKIQEDRLALSGASGLAGDVAATKIVELAKKNREITAETESEKAKVKQLNNRVKELEKELQAAVEKIHSLGGGDVGIKQSALKMIEGNLAESPEVKALQEKLTAANFKVMEYRNQLQSAKQELKMTQKLLANEVGEDVNIQSLLTNSGSWRGRAQQILVLQSKKKSAHQGDGSGAADPSPSEHSEDLSFTLLKPLASGSNQVGRIGSARLAGTDSPDLKALQTQITEHRALCQAAEVERDRLLELVTVLQKRRFMEFLMEEIGAEDKLST